MGKSMVEYIVHMVTHYPEFRFQWNGKAWGDTPCLEISSFRPESSDHRPTTRAKLLYGPEGVFGLFQVKDRYVRCRRTGFQEAVYKDSCVEFFVQPKPAGGYFNFEFNCGGAALMYYITDPGRVPGGFKDYTRLSPDEGQRVIVRGSMPAIIEPEIEEEVSWYLEFFIPFSLLQPYVGDFDFSPDAGWRANFYKCGDETSHPHWAAWSPVDELNFHLPRCFGKIRFAPSGSSIG